MEWACMDCYLEDFTIYLWYCKTRKRSPCCSSYHYWNRTM